MKSKAILLANLAAAGILMGLSACDKDEGSGPVKDKVCYTHDCKGLNCCMGYQKNGDSHTCVQTATDSFTVADAHNIKCTVIKKDNWPNCPND